MFKPRENQAEILAYHSGKMGISAVPGSGKTHTLSYLAAQLIVRGNLAIDQEILIVTLVNSAVDNFTTRIAGFCKEARLLENVGYRVRTLHGLAHDILQERPDLVGLSNQFSIIDEIESNRMIEQIAIAYARLHPDIAQYVLKPDVDPVQLSRSPNGWNELIISLNQNFIQQAKDLQAEPEQIIQKMHQYEYSDVLLEMGIEVYQQYQRGLRYRNALDFADLIRLADQALQNDPNYLERLRYRWPYILEDEAQDSSSLQEQMLRRLVGERGNWVRVGDTNQAIYESFTTASPQFLKNFLNEKDVLRKTLPHSGRSNLSIIHLANSLIEWTRKDHPVIELRDSLDFPLIQPTPFDDPQPNPKDHPYAIYIRKEKSSPEEEITRVVENLKRWLPEHTDKTVAVLCPIGWYGEKVAEALHNANIPMVELLKSSQSTRRIAAILEKVLHFLAEPTQTAFFYPAIKEIVDFQSETVSKTQTSVPLYSALRKLKRLEEFFYPAPGNDWTGLLNLPESDSEHLAQLADLRLKFIRWQLAADLPIDQLVLTIAQDLFTSPAELALAHKFALLLEFSASLHPEYELLDFSSELRDISSNIRKFTGFSDEELRFDPDAHKGKVFVSTYHKAKGLEWDRVYLMSVNNYDFPSVQPFDSYVSEKWFLRDNFNPHAETLDRLSGLLTDHVEKIHAPMGEATLNARVKYAAERLRLLFVGITRARESVVITWNTGSRKDKQMALPLEALYAYWKGQDESA
ncbi:MAG: ATP-dependent helicase [Anaerolineaceae bacterium]